ncbi:metabotropic glutamate receptor 3-like [Antedon mediterranea]|uniref:metabotropic glutamate receptor 3-like n=1 Tax=Antedon mediterranea TaxID=105859 RepID=UPI003AF6ABBC
MELSIEMILISIIVCSLQFGESLQAKNYTKQGDIILGGLFPLHLYDETTGTCGQIRELNSLKRVEAMVYTINKINEDNIFPNMTIGYEIYDTCSYPSETLKCSLNLIPKQRTNECHCKCDCANSTEGACTESTKRVTGVVGAQRSSSSVQAAVLFGVYGIPQISYLSTSDELSNKLKYKYFLRTVPPDKYQIQSIVDILVFYNWTYVSFVNSDDSYGENALKAFKFRIKDLGICLATTKSVSIHAPDEYYNEVVNDLDMAKKATVVILYVQLEVASGIFEAVSRLGIKNRFIWIGSDGWGNYGLNAVKGNEDAALVFFIISGALTIQPYSNSIPTFDEYFYSITPSDTDNPWAIEFWERYRNCSSREPIIGLPPCDHLTLAPIANDTDSPAHDSLVMDSVLSFIHALQDMKDQQCQINSERCSKFTPDDGKALMPFLLKTRFDSPSNGQVTFDENGDSQPRYKIKNLQKINDVYTFVDVGSWSEESNFKNDSEVKWNITNDNSTVKPKSSCSDPCETGYATIISEETPCCWTCVKCLSSSIVTDSDRGTRCEPCDTNEPPFYFPNENRTRCEVIDGTFVTKEHPWAIILIMLSSAGITVTFVILVAYIKNRNTPLIKASSRELSYIIFCGIFCGFVCALFHGIRPGPSVCVFRRIGSPISVALIYASVTTKTVRVYRIFKTSAKSARRPKFISSQSQLLIAFSVAIFQILWMLIWLLIVPPTVKYIMPNKNEGTVIMLCSAWDNTEGTVDIEVIGSLAYNIILVLISCVYAFMTRKLPDNYNETRFINFCSFSTLVIIVAFSPPYFTTNEPQYKAIYKGYGLVINGTIALICLFVVKIYALYFVNDEEMNVFTQSRIRANTKTSIRDAMPAIQENRENTTQVSVAGVTEQAETTS